MSTILAMPKFSKGQYVTFLGGEGFVQSFKLDAKTWTYSVEMLKGPEPEFGWVGNETVILLHETEMQSYKGLDKERSIA